MAFLCAPPPPQALLAPLPLPDGSPSGPMPHLFCKGCFPRYYAYAPTPAVHQPDGASGPSCISELLAPSMTVPEFLRRVVFGPFPAAAAAAAAATATATAKVATARAADAASAAATATATAARLDAVKRLLMEGLHALALLQVAHVQHHDLGVANILVRTGASAEQGGGAAPDSSPFGAFRLAFIDFGNSKHGGHTESRFMRKVQAHGGCSPDTFDAYSFACSMIDALFYRCAAGVECVCGGGGEL
jgi:hypothetical protein